MPPSATRRWPSSSPSAPSWRSGRRSRGRDRYRWGSFALHAAAKYGCRVATTMVSKAQEETATRPVKAAGLTGQIEVLGSDDRDLQGTFDKLVSIEMIEAVDWATARHLLRDLPKAADAKRAHAPPGHRRRRRQLRARQGPRRLCPPDDLLGRVHTFDRRYLRLVGASDRSWGLRPRRHWPTLRHDPASLVR